MLAFLVGLMWGQGSMLRRISPQQRRMWWAIWSGHIPAILLTPVVCWQSGVDNLLVVYPLWAIIAAITFMSMANLAGFMFVTGTFLFLLSLLMSLLLPYAPLMLGAVMSANMLYLGAMLRRMIRE
jgi:hypothetical protein